MKKEKLSLEIREDLGKGAARQLRMNHKLPGIVYGKNFEPIKVSIIDKELRNIVNHGTRVLDIELSDKTKETAILKEIQVDPVNNQFIHADFQVVKDEEEFKISVPVKLQNAKVAHGVRMGGQLVQHNYKINIKTTLKNLPDQISVDITDLDNQEAVIVRDLPQDNYRILSHPTVAICSISKARPKA